MFALRRLAPLRLLFSALVLAGCVNRPSERGTSLDVRRPPTLDLERIREVNGILFTVGARGTILRSDDRGATWRRTAVPTNKPLPFLTDVTKGTDTGFVAVGKRNDGDPDTQYSLYSNDGQSWRFNRMTDGQWNAAAHGRGVTVAVEVDAGLVRRGGVDGSETAIELPEASCAARLKDIVWTGRSFLVTGSCGELYRSEDGGRWSVSEDQLRIGERVALWADSQGVIAAHPYGLISVSQDDGQTWRLASSDLNSGVYTGTSGIARAGGVIISVGLGGVLRSVDGGRTLYRVSNREDLRSVWGDNGTFVAVGRAGIVRSTDGGVTWQDVPCCSTP